MALAIADLDPELADKIDDSVSVVGFSDSLVEAKIEAAGDALKAEAKMAGWSPKLLAIKVRDKQNTRFWNRALVVVTLLMI